MESNFSYRFSNKAKQDLINILRYISIDLGNPQAAKNFKLKLTEKLTLACVFPEMGALAENHFLTDSTTRKLSVGNYLIFYVVDNENNLILIARIIYEKRNMDEIFKQS